MIRDFLNRYQAMRRVPPADDDDKASFVHEDDA